MVNKKTIQKIKPWVKNKIKAVRKLPKHRAMNQVGFMVKRLGRFGAPTSVALVILFIFISFISPKDNFQKAKEQLAKNPNDFEAHLILAEEFLKNNQFEEAERILLLAQRAKLSRDQVLGKEINAKLEELWERKHYSDPKDIQRLIAAWREILKEKPGYRDGHLQLALLYYKIYEDEKAKGHLEKAIELDPNYEMAKELEKVISD